MGANVTKSDVLRIITNAVNRAVDSERKQYGSVNWAYINGYARGLVEASDLSGQEVDDYLDGLKSMVIPFKAKTKPKAVA